MVSYDIARIEEYKESSRFCRALQVYVWYGTMCVSCLYIKSLFVFIIDRQRTQCPVSAWYDMIYQVYIWVLVSLVAKRDKTLWGHRLDFVYWCVLSFHRFCLVFIRFSYRIQLFFQYERFMIFWDQITFWKKKTNQLLSRTSHFVAYVRVIISCPDGKWFYG